MANVRPVQIVSERQIAFTIARNARKDWNDAKEGAIRSRHNAFADCVEWRGRRSPQGRRKISSVAAGMAIHNAGADVVARLADLATNDDHSPLFGAPGAT